MFSRSIRIWRSVAAMMLAGIATWISVGGARADQPVAVVSFSSVGELLNDVQYVAQSVGAGDAAGMVMMMSNAYTQGWDRERPVGLVVSVDDQNEIKPLALLPIRNLESALKPLEANLGTPRDAGDGVKELQGPQPLFVFQRDNWVLLGQSAEAVKNATVVPADVLGPLSTEYDIAVRAFVRNVPEQYKQMAIGQMESGIQGNLQRQPQETDDAFELRKRVAEAQLNQFKQLFDEADQFTVGLKVDKENQISRLDVVMTAVPGTSLHNQLAGARGNKTGFSGFSMPDAALRMVGAAKISSEEIQQSVDMLTNAREAALKHLEQEANLPDENAKTVAKQLLTDLLKMMEDTIRSGRMDFAGSVSLQPGKVNVVGAAYLVDAKRLEATLRELAKLAEGQPDAPTITFNADVYGSVAFHTLEIPIPEEAAPARTAFGDTLNIALGLDQQAAYIAVGEGSLAAAKTAIDVSQTAGLQDVPASEMLVSVRQVLKFADSVASNPQLRGALAALEQEGTKDQISIRAQAVENGVLYRVQVDEGVLKMIGGTMQPIQQRQVQLVPGP